jgi:hypothetical protein
MKAMIDPGIWTDPDFDHIDTAEPILVYLWSISNFNISATGCFRLSFRTATNNLRMSRKDIESAFQALGKTIRFDPKTLWVWVPGYFSRQFTKVPHRNMVKSVVKTINALRGSDCPFVAEFEEKHDSLIKLFESAYEDVSKVPGEGEGEGEGEEKRSTTKPLLTTQQVLGWWNPLAAKYGLSQLEALTTARRNKMRVRAREGLWEARGKIEAGIAASRFLREGSEDRNWRMNFDWLVKNSTNWVKIVEGQYASNGNRPAGEVDEEDEDDPGKGAPGPLDIKPEG